MALEDHHDLLHMRQENIGRLLQRAARDYSERALVKLEQHGHAGLTLFHTALISNLDIEGTQISVLAERAGMTKQSMGQVAHELEVRGYITRVDDPKDGRAIRLLFTEKGMQFLEDAYRAKLELEADYAYILGEAGFAQLRDMLGKLVAKPAQGAAPRAE